MLKPARFYKTLAAEGVTFYTGVPDSLLKHFCAFVTDTAGHEDHVITHNEGGAIALATGYHLATGGIPLVYMQNSGQGNAVNPLTSLADPAVYSIPMVLLIGWRGQPGTEDEPQHIKQGRITEPLMDALEIPYAVLPEEHDEARTIVEEAVKTAKEEKRPFALLVPRGTFAPYELEDSSSQTFEMTREDAVIQVAQSAPADAVFVSTTGKTSRELFEHRAREGQGHERDFLTVGSMGHVSQIALGIAEKRPDTPVWCVDGDGSVIMHMGALAINGQRAPANLKHVILNNGAHDSVGGQPTTGLDIDIPQVAEACGYHQAWSVSTKAQTQERLKDLAKAQGPVLLEIRVAKGARADLGRPTMSTMERKQAFMENLREP